MLLRPGSGLKLRSVPEDQVDARVFEQTILDEAFWVMGFDRRPWLRRLLEPIFRWPVGRFARLAAGFENGVARDGLQETCGQFMGQFVSEVDIIGEENLPAGGPLLIAANHPAAYDFFLIAATLPRDDMKLIASNINIVRRLPATAGHFIFIGSDQVMGDSHSRMAAVRAGVRHLREGGALLIFPTGTVDPDPAVSPEGARRVLDDWSPSLELFLRRAPETRVVVAMVGGVLSERWFNSPVTWLRKEPHNKQKVAEIFQVMQQLFFPNTLKLRPRLAFSRPLALEELRGEDGRGEVVPALVAEAEKMLAAFAGRP